MLTGEYFVLDGARALALPTQLGQHLTVRAKDNSNTLYWKSINDKGEVWFETEIDAGLHRASTQNSVSTKLLELLRKARDMNPAFDVSGFEVEIISDFNLQWGLGSSSTLVSLIAQWAQVNPYELQFTCFGGSGYDIACATADGPIVYERWPEPLSLCVAFNPSFANQLHFIYLGKKQDSRKGISQYQERSKDRSAVIKSLNEITEQILKVDDLKRFEQLLEQHEDVISQNLQLKKVKDQFFVDFEGSCKSLGAWGGDFILAASQMSAAEVKTYFHSKGFTTIVPYSGMVLVSD